MEGTVKLTRDDVDEILSVWDGYNDALKVLKDTKNHIRAGVVYPELDDAMKNLEALKLGIFDEDKAEKLFSFRSLLAKFDKLKTEVMRDKFNYEYGAYIQDFIFQEAQKELDRLLDEYTK